MSMRSWGVSLSELSEEEGLELILKSRERRRLWVWEKTPKKRVLKKRVSVKDIFLFLMSLRVEIRERLLR